MKFHFSGVKWEDSFQNYTAANFFLKSKWGAQLLHVHHRTMISEMGKEFSGPLQLTLRSQSIFFLLFPSFIFIALFSVCVCLPRGGKGEFQYYFALWISPQ